MKLCFNHGLVDLFLDGDFCKMSIYCEFDVGPSGRRFRRAVHEDIRDIELFLDRKQIENIFGDIDIGSLIELSVLSICMITKTNEVVGFLSLNDYPNVYGVSPNDWEIWMRNMFQRYYVSRNTLFIQCMCCKDTVLEYFLEEALLSVFYNDVYLWQIVLIASTECNLDHIVRNSSLKQRKMYKYPARREDDSLYRSHYMYVALRQDYVPKLKIRRAVEEDNDDIVEILDKTSPRLKELYGAYYISEIIGQHPESKRKIIVAEHQDRAIGVMCLNAEVNYKKLQSIYELKSLHGLRKVTPLEKEKYTRTNILLNTFGDPIMKGTWSPFDEPSRAEQKDTAKPVSSVSAYSLKKRVSKVNFKKRPSDISVDVKASEDSSFFSGASYPHSCTSLISNLTVKSVEMLLDDDDPFDYEIINIDKNLLAIPEALSTPLLPNINTEESEIRSDVYDTKSSRISLRPTLLNRVKKKKPVTEKESDRENDIEYCGDGNAFAIELFGLHEDVDQRSAFDLLEVAFDLMKDYDYCILRVPSADKTFPLLQHFCYMPIKTRVCCKYSLFVAHRNSVLGKLRVREAEFIDIPHITRLIRNIECKDTIYTIEHSIISKECHSYVFMSGVSLIGVGILEPPEQINFLRTKYNMDPYHNHLYHLPGQGSTTGFSVVKVVLVYPVFEVHFRYFAREMMRLSGSNTLIWMTAYRNKWVAHKANSLAAAMVPLIPRKMMLDYPSVPELWKISVMEKKVIPFCTWFLDKKLDSVPCVPVSTRIVVLGASRTTMACLDALLFGSGNTYLTFTSVTLISANGLPYLRHHDAVADTMFPIYYNNTDKYLKSVPYTYYVNTVQGTMVGINKQDKYVTLTSGTRYYYDILILSFGKQYQHPDYMESLIEKDITAKNDGSSYIRMDVPRKSIDPELIKYNTPDNVFIINHLGEASEALKFVKKCLMYHYNAKFIVYGATIHAYCCLTALLEANVPPRSIIFVEPFPSENPCKTRVSVFNNCIVDETVCNVIDSLGIKVYRSYYFKSWTVFNNNVTNVEFISYFNCIKEDCSAFFYFGKRGVDTNAFFAINKCGMAYDAGIVIDHQFRTKDPCIYAAGPATTYYKRYYAQEKKQKYYDSYEVGYMLGTQIRRLLDPLFTEKSQTNRRNSVSFSNASTSASIMNETKSSMRNSEGSRASCFSRNLVKPDDKIPNFKKPKVKYCKLPGGLQFFSVRSPGKKIPHHYMHTQKYTGIVMETYKSGYFKIHMNNDFVVDSITCLTPEKYNLENFKNIYGFSSAALNNVYLRYTTKKLDDFYDFFRSPWAFFLYHDQVDDLFAMVKELLPKGRNQTDTIEEALQKVQMSVCDSITTSCIKTEIRKHFDATPHVEVISDYVMEWLSENDATMPMYLQPSQRMEFIHDMERNHFFKKKTSVSQLISKIL